MKRTFLMLLFWLSIVSVLLAQARPALRRNMLDASPQIGAGGYNAPVNQRRYYPGYGNLFITGNVTGGKAFRGYVPYSNPTQFRAPLGSSSLSSFRRESIGLREIRSGHIYGKALPYFQPSSTILPLSAQQRLGSPGSSKPRLPTPTRPPTYSTGASMVRPAAKIPGQQLPGNIRQSDILLPSIIIEHEAPGKREIPHPMEPSPAKEIQEPETTEWTPLAPVLKPMEGREPLPPQQQEQDLTSYLQMQAQQAEKFEIKIGPQPEFAKAAERLAVEAKLKATTQPAKKQSKFEMGKPLTGKSPIVVTTLAGKGSSPFNRIMQAAQKSLIQGKFFRAYNQYSDALIIKPDDPLAMFGQAHALVAAGKLRSAADNLERALEKFPKFVNLNLKGDRLLGGKAIFSRRLNQVKNLTAKHDDQQLKLLLEYLEILNGNREKAH